MYPADKPATRGDVQEIVDTSVNKLQETLVGGMNQMLETIVTHIDKVDNHVVRLENKFDIANENIKQRVTKLEQHQV